MKHLDFLIFLLESSRSVVQNHSPDHSSLGIYAVTLTFPGCLTLEQKTFAKNPRKPIWAQSERSEQRMKF
jgi:hypothetical protein